MVANPGKKEQGSRSTLELIQEALPFILIVSIGGVISIMNPRFLAWENLSNILLQYSGTAFVALGAMMVLISGGIDFSTAEIMALGSTLGGIWYLQGENDIVLLIVGCVLVGLIVGVINGVLIAYLKFQPFIATLAMQALIHGVMMTLAEGKLIMLEGNPAVDYIGKGRILNLPAAFVFLAIFGVIMLVIMKRTKLGVYTYAMGGNEESLRSSGVNIRAYKLLVYIMAGLCAGLGTVLITCRMKAVYSSVSSTLLLDAIAATVIGGTSVRGGKGNVIGTIIGAMIIGVIANSMTLLNVPSNMHNVVKGATIIFALLIDVAVNARGKE